MTDTCSVIWDAVRSCERLCSSENHRRVRQHLIDHGSARCPALSTRTPIAWDRSSIQCSPICVAAIRGDCGLLESLLPSCPSYRRELIESCSLAEERDRDFGSHSFYYRAPLHHAIMAGNVACVLLLINAGAYINVRSGEIEYCWCCGYFNQIRGPDQDSWQIAKRAPAIQTIQLHLLLNSVVYPASLFQRLLKTNLNLESVNDPDSTERFDYVKERLPSHLHRSFPGLLAHVEEQRLIQAELAEAQLSTPIFPLRDVQLRTPSVREQCDLSRLECYIGIREFQPTFAMSKEEFQSLPRWKQANLKKQFNLF